MSEIDHFVTDRSPLRPGDAVAAIIVVEDGRYLLQLRDNKPGIFYPGHWGLFGGGIDAGETPIEALHREILEELGIIADDVAPLSRFDFDLTPMGLERIYRTFFEVRISVAALGQLRLGEGTDVRAFARDAALALPRIVPYDAFALWFHANADRLQP